MQVKSVAECNLQYILTFIKLPFVIKIFVLSIFEWPFYTGVTVIAHKESKTKVRKAIRIRNLYNHVPHLFQDTQWESNKITIKIPNKSQEVSPFPSGDHNAAMNRRESMTNTRHKILHHLGTVSKNMILVGLNRFHGAPASPLVQM